MKPSTTLYVPFRKEVVDILNRNKFESNIDAVLAMINDDELRRVEMPDESRILGEGG
jgi:hypothetical protein